MDFQNLKVFLDQITAWRIPGADCTVRIEGKEVFRYQSGYADLENKKKMTSTQLFNLYSTSKIATCTAALQLYEKGAFLMSDPLYEYLPEFKEMFVEEKRINGEPCDILPAKNPIRVGDLFTMTAGFTYDLAMPSIRRTAEATNEKCPTREISKAIAKSPLLFEPGSRWNYSLCHDVLGALVEVLSGEKFGDYLEKNIFAPLGMKDTGFHLPPDKKERMASQYQFNDETGKADNVGLENGYVLGSEYESGGAGLISSIDDYVLFLDALCNMGRSRTGEYIIGSRTVNLMRSNHLSPIQMEDFSWFHMYGYGYGLGVRTLMDKAKGSSLGTIGEFGWSGAAGAFALMDPELDLTVFYTQHLLNSQEPYVHPRLRNLIYSSLEK